MGKDGDLIIKMREKLRHTKLLYKNDYDSYIALIDSYTELQQILKDERKEYESLLQDYNTKKKRLQ
ncbi:MAG: hypothetical protein GY853_07565 [PVC group bacterium]|nr:hypothetical protein [PVC group bacterium]